MKLAIELDTAASIALRRYFMEVGPLSLEAAAAEAIREFLRATGYLEPDIELDEDTETIGEA